MDTMRVDVVGSFLRPAALKDAFRRALAGRLSPAELRAVQDTAIRDLVAKQEAHGLPLANDGEFRRVHFMESFADVAGMDPWRDVLSGKGYDKPGGDPNDPMREIGSEVRCPVTRRIGLVRNVPLHEYDFVARLTALPVKVTITGPDRIAQRFAYEESAAFYRGLDEFVDDVVRVQKEMIAGLERAGCRYVQTDANGYTAYVDPATTAAMRARGEDPARNLERSIAADNAIVTAFPALTFGIHLCRGSGPAPWQRGGSYDRIAERLFNGLAHQRFLLEYDDEDDGGFEALRYVPKGKVVVLGLIPSTRKSRDTVAGLRRRIEAAARYLPLEQLALSPQCGFASASAEKALDEDDQWKKIDVLMKTAKAVWGKG